MGKPSMMMMGSRMSTDVDAAGGRAVGSRIRMHGRVLGLAISLEEVVVARQPPLRKSWETVGEPRLLIIARYRMGFEIAPKGTSSRLRVFIEFALPTTPHIPGWANFSAAPTRAGAWTASRPMPRLISVEHRKRSDQRPGIEDVRSIPPTRTNGSYARASWRHSSPVVWIHRRALLVIMIRRGAVATLLVGADRAGQGLACSPICRCVAAMPSNSVAIASCSRTMALQCAGMLALPRPLPIIPW